MIKASEAFGGRLLARAREKRQGPFNVGLLIPTSGAMGLLGPCAFACARLARESWNERGGVDGREVRLTVINSSESAHTLDDELRDLLDAGDVDALVALSNTEVCRRIARIVDARVPLIYTPMFEGTGLPAWVHAIGETPERQLLPAIDWMATEFRPRRWYLIGNDYSWPRRCHTLAIPGVKASGAEVVRERYVPLGERDFGGVVDDVVSTRADVVLVSLLAGDAVHFCRAFEHAGLGSKVLRLSICVEENAVLGVGRENSDGMFVAAGYFAALESDVNGAFKERYRNRFGERAPALNSASQSVYEGFVHLYRQVFSKRGDRKMPGLPGVRDDRREPYDAGRNPIFLGAVQGLGIRPVRRLSGEPE